MNNFLGYFYKQHTAPILYKKLNNFLGYFYKQHTTPILYKIDLILYRLL